jgi:hypothetical protein
MYKVLGSITLKKTKKSWLMPIILVTREAKIRRMVVQSQPGQIVCETLISKIPNT